MTKYLMVTLMFASASAAALAPPMPDGGWFYGICHTHDWRGHARDSDTEAWKDAYAHKDLHPGEQHKIGIERSDR